MKRIAISTVLALAACGSNKTTGPNGNGPDANANAPDADPNAPDANPNAPDANPNAPDANPSQPDAMPAGAKPVIVTILMENHDYNEILGSGKANAPYINSLAAKYGLATNYKDTGHPSLPNYLHAISGDNQYPGFVDLDPTQAPYFPVKSTATNPGNLGDQMATAGIKWRSYQEGPDANTPSTPCELSTNGEYAPKHDPFLYFDNIQNRNGTQAYCKSVNVDYKTNFATDLATGTYQYMWITPNLIDDGHDGSSTTASLTTSDTWLKNNLPAILNSDAYKAGGVIFLTWDEAEGRNGDDPDLIPMIVISNRIKTPGMTLATAWTHSNYLATVEDMLGLPRLPTVTSATTLSGFLN